MARRGFSVKRRLRNEPSCVNEALVSSPTPNSKLPRHVAIIMDGNGRWAGRRHLPRVAGHHQGAVAVRKVVTHARRLGIRNLTLYAFSAQNWLRPVPEVSALMSLLGQFIESERSTILDNDIRLVTIGDIERLPAGLKRALDVLVEDSASNQAMTLCLALSYGGQEEAAVAARRLAEQVERGELKASEIDLDRFQRELWSADLGPVDLMIRTSGELRVSNFMLLGLAYAELYFTELYWPDFDEQAFDEAMASYAQRQRRYGAVP